MSELLEAIQDRHREKLERRDRGEIDEPFVEGVRAFIADLRQAGAVVVDPVERGQLRALMRFWAHFLYEEAGVYPDTMLEPPEVARTRSPVEKEARAFPPLLWLLIGGATVIVIAVGLMVVGWMSRSGGEMPESSATPAPVAAVVQLGAGVSGGGELDRTSTLFCKGTSEIDGEIVLSGVEPDTLWRWQVERDGEIVAEQPALAWGEEERRLVRLLGGGTEGVQPGGYELTVFVAGRTVVVEAFTVAQAEPTISELLLSDVPDGETPSSGFVSNGIRVLYANGVYTGMCPGAEVVATLAHEGDVIQEQRLVWDGGTNGEEQLTFSAPNGEPFVGGEYTVSMRVADGERRQATILVGEEETSGPEPAFGLPTFALGVEADGTPIHREPDEGFNWNAKVVYAIFDYRGMQDGMEWEVVWMRDEEEVDRQHGFWDLEERGAEGTTWVAYYDELGWALRGGEYTVTLWLDGEMEQEAEFSIQVYTVEE